MEGHSESSPYTNTPGCQLMEEGARLDDFLRLFILNNRTLENYSYCILMTFIGAIISIIIASTIIVIITGVYHHHR
jgi:hypothetical protein